MEMNFEGRAEKKKKRKESYCRIRSFCAENPPQIITNSLLILFLCILASSAAFEVCFSKSKGK